MHRVHLALPCLCSALLAAAGCGPTPLVCRAPEVNDPWDDASSCFWSVHRCEGGEELSVHCENDTYDGSYECMWVYTSGEPPFALGSFGTFTSEDFCTLDADEMLQTIEVEIGYRVTVD